MFFLTVTQILRHMRGVRSRRDTDKIATFGISPIMNDIGGDARKSDDIMHMRPGIHVRKRLETFDNMDGVT